MMTDDDAAAYSRELMLRTGAMIGKRGHTVATLAKTMGADRAHLHRVLAGQKQVSLAYAARLAAALGMTLRGFLRQAAKTPLDGARSDQF